MSNDATPPDYSGFGRPIFEDPEARAVSRVAVIDIGSNSIRMVVFDGAARSPAYFFNEKVMCGLGSGAAETGRLNPEGRERAMTTLRRFAALARGMSAVPVLAVATAAMRETSDGPSFREELEAATGLEIRVIDGPEEARLSAQGVLLGLPGAEGLVCDIGGSSMELARLSGGAAGDCATSPLGPLHLQAMAAGKKALRAEIDKRLADLRERFGPANGRLYLVGGSWRAIARIDMERRGYPLHVLHEYRMTPESLLTTIKYIGARDVSALRSQTGIGESRMSLVPLAAQVLRGVIGTFDPEEIVVSSYGIREGLLYEQMPPLLRKRDPLIESCRFSEKKDARIPGFGRALYHFVEPLFRGEPPARLRIVRAACLLHDVNWRSHPDYRHEVCFDSATRANLGGLDHAERVFLGLALLHRYKNSRTKTRLSEMLSILSDAEISAAEILGKAMRFGAMFTAGDTTSLGELRWSCEDKHLKLRLPEAAQVLFGEVAESRFSSLVSALGATSEVIRT